jgi:hypothetical protein
MLGERFVVLGMAGPRTRWFTDVARWSTSSAVPCEFVKCLSSEEARARLASNRAFSALLLDGGLPNVDRDLLEQAAAAGCAVLVVDVDPPRRNWYAFGADAILAEPLEPDTLVDALRSAASPVARVDHAVFDAPVNVPPEWRARLVAVTGAPGAGASTLSMAIAQGLAATEGEEAVVLADLALRADLAMLHDAGDIVPGVQELVEESRLRSLDAETVRSLTFLVPDRGYHLLLGLRRPSDWAVLRPRAFAHALASLRRAFRIVVADADDDVEGHSTCGSVEVEERNVMARTVTANADLVVAVGREGPAGLFRLARSVTGLLDHGIAPERLQTAVVSSAGRRARARHQRAFAELLEAAGRPPLASPIFVPRSSGVESSLRDGKRLPNELTTVVTRSVAALLTQAPPSPVEVPDVVVPGSLGRWGDDAAEGIR